ncbi:MAG: HD domain-containing protein [Candidatus Cryptobacteroides sp.]|nr:HD domain-containing protein [Candidatus Cryptobacteroides sp.]
MVNPELEAFIEAEIIPEYKSFGRSHNVEHVRRVISNSLELAKFLGDGKIDEDMAYAIAAYHDLGMSGPREIHHITSGKILMEDTRLRKWFSPEQLLVMKEAVEDHRASSDHAPRSVYGRIVAEADRDLEPDVVFTRAIEYGLEHYPELGKEAQWRRFAKHMDEKYSSNGYITLWIPGSPNERNLKQIRAVIADRNALRRTFNEIFDRLNHHVPSSTT